MINIAIADDHLLFAQSLKQFLETEKNINVVGLAGNGLELLQIVSCHKVNLVVVDIRMPVMDGFTTCKALKSFHPDIKIVLLSMFEEAHPANEFKHIGASGYISKSCSGADFMNVIFAVHRGETVLPEEYNVEKRELSGQTQAGQPAGELTSREREIVSLIGRGLTSPAIAAKLFISVNTVKEHRKQIFRKLNFSNVQEVVAYAVTQRLC